MTEEITVSFEDEQFSVRCPRWSNDLVAAYVPDKRWLKSKLCWKVRPLRKAVMGLVEMRKIAGVRFDESAIVALGDYLTKLNNMAASQKKGAFPSWYPFRKELQRADGTGADSYPPYKHGLKALDKMWNKHCFALHHDMGTAKTRTYIDFMCAKRMEGSIDSAVIVVKLSGRRNWREQLLGPMSIGKVLYKEGWAPIPVDVYLPTTDEPRAFERWLGATHDFKVMVVGVESLSQGNMAKWLERFVLSRGKCLMIIDEAHLIANHKAERTKVCIKVGEQAVWRGTATGTPISTGPLNLYSQFNFLDPDIIGIGDFYAFRNQYAMVIEKKDKAKGHDYSIVVGYKNIDELTKTVAPYVDEVRKADVLDLPPKNYLPHVYVQLSKEQRALYDQIKREKAYYFKGKEVVVKNVLELALRLHTICGGWAATYEEVPYLGRGGDEKIRRIPTWHEVVPLKRNPKIVELVDIASAQRQFIIWAVYRVEIDGIVTALRAAYPKRRICQIHGGIDEGERADLRAAYQKGDYDYMVGNTATGGTADTWTACQTMVYYNNADKLIDRTQSEDRAHRGGLDHPVDYVDLVAEKTVDVTMIKSLDAKMDLSEYIRVNIKNAAELLDG